MYRVNKVSKAGIILMIAGASSNLVWHILFGGIPKCVDVVTISVFCLSGLEIMFGLLLTILGVVWYGTE